MRDIMKRLVKLEERIRPNPLMVLTVVDGQQVEMTAKECVERDLGFIKVTDGHNLNDLDLLLEYIYKIALKECGEETADS